MSSFGFNYNVAFAPLVLTLPLGAATAASDNFSVVFSPKWYNETGVEWEVPADWGSVTYNLYSAPNEEGPFTKLNTVPFSNPFYYDNTTRSFSKYNNTFYIIEAIFPSGQTVQSSSLTVNNTNTPWVRLRREEVTRREWLLLRKFVGVKTYLFKKKSSGARCPDCWNPDSMRIMNDKCPTCLGTSWDGGYWDPIETLFQYGITPNDAVNDYRGVVEPNQIQAWTINVPIVHDFDIVVRYPDVRVYRVERVEPTELQTVTVRQPMVLAELSKESIEFSLLDRITT